MISGVPNVPLLTQVEAANKLGVGAKLIGRFISIVPSLAKIVSYRQRGPTTASTYCAKQVHLVNN